MKHADAADYVVAGGGETDPLRATPDGCLAQDAAVVKKGV